VTVELESRVRGGRLRVTAGSLQSAEAAAELVRSMLPLREPRGEPIRFLGESAWLKADAFPARASLRHALRRLFLRRPVPRLAEYGNLGWLRTRLFEAAEPLAAGCIDRAGFPRGQFLITRRVPDAPTLRVFLERGEEDPGPVLDELAGETARLHALRFVHRDLFPRNLLVRAPEAPRRVVYLDAWRGGARFQLRGAAYDLACFFLHAPELLPLDAQRAFFERYREQRAAQGRPIDAEPFLRAVARERAALLRRLERAPHRLRGRPLPPLDWSL